MNRISISRPHSTKGPVITALRRMKPSDQRFPTVLKGLVVASAAATLISLGFLPASYHRDSSTHWPTTSGVVSAVALKTSFQKPHVRPYFSPSICYSYTVDGIPRASTRIDFADLVRWFPKEEALAWLDQNYPVGKKVTVYYDPKNPDLAVLVPGATDLVFICWSCVGTSASCLVASWVLLIRQKKRLALEGGCEQSGSGSGSASSEAPAVEV